MRTFLSALGIIIGIGSVIALISLGNAAQSTIQTQIESFGVNAINIMPRGTENLTLADAQYLRSDAFSYYFSAISPKLNATDTVTFDDKTTRATIVGVDHHFWESHQDNLQSGRHPAVADDEESNRVLVVGSSIADDLFGQTNPLGQKVYFAYQYWQIIGVFKEGTNDSSIYTPLSSVAQYFASASTNALTSIEITAANSEVANDATSLAKFLMMGRKNIDNVDDLPFTFISFQQMVETMNELMGMFMLFLVGIAAISLLVGGIGIMNIMLVTVVERTREIGLRKALGARKSTIVTQFLVEAMVLTLIGGIFGFLLGLGLAAVFCQIADMDFIISWQGVALGVGVSTAIGLIFGIYPAQKAAKLQPIDALRFD